MKPKISVITINYNNREGLTRTFESVFSQTYRDFEYIVIDGGSTDGGRELIEKHSDQINYWVSEPDKGIYNAMNKGILQAKGEYVFFLNSGDILFNSSSLEIVSKELHTEDIIYFNILVCGENCEFVKKCPPKLNFDFFYNRTLPHQSTFMISKSFKKVGLYDENLKIIADWKWFLMAVCLFNLSYKNIDEIISIYYLDGISSDPTFNDLFLKEKEEILHDLFPYLSSEYDRIKKRDLKLEGYEASRIIKILKKIGFLKGLR